MMADSEKGAGLKNIGTAIALPAIKRIAMTARINILDNLFILVSHLLS